MERTKDEGRGGDRKRRTRRTTNINMEESGTERRKVDVRRKDEVERTNEDGRRSKRRSIKEEDGEDNRRGRMKSRGQKEEGGQKYVEERRKQGLKER